MKLILREKSIKEAELKSASKITKDGFASLINAIQSGIDQGSSEDGVKIKELVYEKSKPLVIGAILQYFSNIKKEKINSNKTLMDAWDPEKKNFKQEFINQILEEETPIVFSFGENVLPKGVAGTAGTMEWDGKIVNALVVNPFLHSTDKDTGMTIRHEAQHITQQYNNYSLYAYNLLKKANFDFTKVEEPDPQMLKPDSSMRKAVGLGKQKTRSPGQPDAPQIDPNLSRAEKEKILRDYSRRYLSDDEEYETWLSDASEKTVEFALDQVITPSQLLFGYLITKHPMLARPAINEDVAVLKALKGVAKQLGMDFDRVQQMIKRSQSLSQLAVFIAKSATKEPLFRKGVGAYARNDVMDLALEMLPEIRPREFIRDFTQQIEQKLKEYAEDKYPFLKSI